MNTKILLFTCTFFIAGLSSGVIWANPEATMPSHSPFAGLTPNWDKKLHGGGRFTVLSSFNNEAVRDNETGLVWERSPGVTGTGWAEGFTVCTSDIGAHGKGETGGRAGWHLPTIEQLASLVDTSALRGLPNGHPFNVPMVNHFISATTVVANQDYAWAVEFNVNGSIEPIAKAAGGFIWCVRGGQAFDGMVH